MSTQEAKSLAAKIARDIFSMGDRQTPCQRIQFMGGEYPDDETSNGGLCEESLAYQIAQSIARHLDS